MPLDPVEHANVIEEGVKTQAEILAGGANSIIEGQTWIASDTGNAIKRVGPGTTPADFQIVGAEKADKVISGVEDNLASLAADGNPKDSGYSADDLKSVVGALTDTKGLQELLDSGKYTGIVSSTHVLNPLSGNYTLPEDNVRLIAPYGTGLRFTGNTTLTFGAGGGTAYGLTVEGATNLFANLTILNAFDTCSFGILRITGNRIIDSDQTVHISVLETGGDDLQYLSAPIQYEEIRGGGRILNGAGDDVTGASFGFNKTPRDISKLDVSPSEIDFDTTKTKPAHKKGKLFWYAAKKCFASYNEYGDVTLELGREVLKDVKNNTGANIPNGASVSIETTDAGVQTIVLACAKEKETATRSIGFATMPIPDGGTGEILVLGDLNDVNTIGFAAGDVVWLSTIAGGITNVEPQSPNYSVRLGIVGVISATIGTIFCQVQHFGNRGAVLQFYNGTFLQDHTATVDVVGVDVVCSLSVNSGTILSPVFNAEFVNLDFTAPATVNLTQGTDENPIMNYVFLDSADNTLKAQIGDFPRDRQVCNVAKYDVPTYTKVASEGLNYGQSYTDHFADSFGRGHLQHQNLWMRNRPAKYISGMLTQATGGSGVFDISVAVGIIEQLHQHATPAFDTATGSHIQIYNDFIESYKIVTSMIDQLIDSLGNSMSGKSFSWFFYEVGSEDDKDSKLYANAPSGSYNNSTSAIEDLQGYTNRSIPLKYTGAAVPLARVTVSHANSGNTYTIQEVEDLRGSGDSGGGSLGTTPPLADVISVSGIVDISAYGVNDRVMDFIKDGIRRFTVWGDGLIAIRKAEIADLATNAFVTAKAFIVKSDVIKANIGLPVYKDATLNIGAGAVIPERYEIFSTETGYLDGSYVEDVATGELFVGYKSWFISGINKRLRPVAETGAGPVYAYAIVEEITPTQYSVLHFDGSDAYFQESPDADDPDNSSYSGNGLYLGDNAGVVYFDAQAGKAARIEGDVDMDGNIIENSKMDSAVVANQSTSDSVATIVGGVDALMASIGAVKWSDDRTDECTYRSGWENDIFAPFKFEETLLDYRVTGRIKRITGTETIGLGETLVFLPAIPKQTLAMSQTFVTDRYFSIPMQIKSDGQIYNPSNDIPNASFIYIEAIIPK